MDNSLRTQTKSKGIVSRIFSWFGALKRLDQIVLVSLFLPIAYLFPLLPGLFPQGKGVRCLFSLSSSICSWAMVQLYRNLAITLAGFLVIGSLHFLFPLKKTIEVRTRVKLLHQAKKGGALNPFSRPPPSDNNNEVKFRL